MKRILVPTDFSECADNALEFAVHLAKKNKAEILLVNVFEYPGGSSYNTLGVTTYEPLDNEFITQILDNIKKKIKERAENPSYEGVIIKYDVIMGNPFTSIASEVDDKDVELIVMGSKGTSGIEGTLIGSNTEKMVRNAKCPVLTIKENTSNFEIKNIAFATNLYGDHAYLLKELKKFQSLFNSQIHIVKVNTPGTFESTHKIRKQFERFAKEYQLENYTFTIYNETSEEDGIKHFAEEINADLIAMGTHGRSGFFQLLSASIAEDVVNSSQRPIWTCRIR
jgi:nucleotide-binding universal stress UspA family protein